MVYNAAIPQERQTVEHDCESWMKPMFDDSASALKRLDELIAKHNNEMLFVLQDMISANVNVSASYRVAAWRFLWTWPVFSEQERVELAGWVIPF
jgi:hypothetical protein